MGTEIAVVRSTGNHERLAPAVTGLLHAYHLQTEAEKGNPVARVDDLPDRYRAEVQDPARAFRGQTVLVALIGPVAAGCVVVTAPQDGRSEIKRLWTDPAFRGQGVATRLVEAALAQADEVGASSVRLSVWDWRSGAIACYERLGFGPTASWDVRDHLLCMERDVPRDTPAVVLVHGLFGAFGDERMRSRLAAHRVVAPDLLGYGADTRTRQAITLDAQVEHLRELLGPRPVHLVGHSVGGVIAMLYAHRYPDDVLGVVNVEGNFTLADAFWSAELARKPAVEAAGLLERYRTDPGAWFGGTPDPYRLDSARAMLAFQPASTLQAMAASVVAVTGAPSWEPLLRGVFARLPVQLVAGGRSRRDWHVPDWAVRAASSCTEIPEAGHVMMYDAPEAFGDTLSAIIRS